jgi:hypothetical protein
MKQKIARSQKSTVTTTGTQLGLFAEPCNQQDSNSFEMAAMDRDLSEMNSMLLEFRFAQRLMPMHQAPLKQLEQVAAMFKSTVAVLEVYAQKLESWTKTGGLSPSDSKQLKRLVQGHRSTKMMLDETILNVEAMLVDRLKRPQKGRRSPVPETRERQMAYQLKITLRNSQPPIWRRILVPDSLTLGQLHRLIQAAMGWNNEHLHQFVINKLRYSSGDAADGSTTFHENNYHLYKFGFTAGAKFQYEYDFGDSWLHDIVVEKSENETVDHPVCLAGKRACPPEDCGGIYGYTRLLDALSNPSTPSSEHLRDWVGEDFDPEYFSIEQVNARWAKVKV